MDDNKKYSVSWNWTQPYTNWQPWVPAPLNLYNESMMDAVEEHIKLMISYPDAEEIIKKVRNGL